MKIPFLSIVIALLLTGCSTRPIYTPSSVQIRYSAFLGKTIPLFILSNGVPYSKKSLPDGRTLHAWNSERNGFILYQKREHRFRFGLDDDFMKSECEIRMLTNTQGKIISILAFNNPRKTGIQLAEGTICTSPSRTILS